MVDFNRYIVDGFVKRGRIVEDIQRGLLSKNDINELDNNPLVKEAYFGEGGLNKRVKEEWSEIYLEELALNAVSETFNLEYLLFLSEVSEYVQKDNEKKEHNRKIFKTAVSGIICLIIMGFIIVVFTSKSKKDSATSSTNGIPFTKKSICVEEK